MSRHAKATRSHTLGAPLRGRGVIEESEHDPYRAAAKPRQPVACPQCHAVFRDGRWQWGSNADGAREQLCPACRRVRDRFPAGYVTIEGEFFQAHRDEVMDLVNHRVQRASAEHPLERLMAVEPGDAGGVLLTTTDTHLARGIGEALHHAYRGELQFRYEPAQNLLRVHWKR